MHPAPEEALPVGTDRQDFCGVMIRMGSRLDIGCVAAHGWFACDDAECHVIKDQGKPATAFLLELIARLQGLATVPMIDIRAYAKWLTD